jgi:flagellar biosynthesis protein FlhF
MSSNLADAPARTNNHDLAGAAPRVSMSLHLPIDPAPHAAPVAPLAATATAAPAGPELRTFRGRTLEELLPKIRAELGAEAIVVRQRDGLMGGIGGFFQQHFVEVEARAGHARIDVYDEPPVAAPHVFEPPALEPPALEPLGLEPPALEPTAAAPAAPEPFALQLAAAEAHVEEAIITAMAPAPPVVEAPTKPKPAHAPRTAQARAIVSALTARGLSQGLAEELLADAAAHVLPFTPDGDLRAAVRGALARRIPVAELPPPGGRAIAFVGAGGAGKTRCVAGLASAHAQAGALPVVCLTLAAADDGAELTRLLAPHGVTVEPISTPAAARTRLARAREDALVVLDTPAVSPGDARAIAELASGLVPLALDETQLVVPAPLSAGAAAELRERLAPLRPTGIAMSHADTTDHLGPVVELACACRVPLAYVADGLALPGALAPADPLRIAEGLLP